MLHYTYCTAKNISKYEYNNRINIKFYIFLFISKYVSNKLIKNHKYLDDLLFIIHKTIIITKYGT